MKLPTKSILWNTPHTLSLAAFKKKFYGRNLYIRTSVEVEGFWKLKKIVCNFMEVSKIFFIFYFCIKKTAKKYENHYDIAHKEKKTKIASLETIPLSQVFRGWARRTRTTRCSLAAIRGPAASASTPTPTLWAACATLWSRARPSRWRRTCSPAIFTHTSALPSSDVTHCRGQTVFRTKYIDIKSTTVYVPSLELGLSHTLSRQRVCPSPRN